MPSTQKKKKRGSGPSANTGLTQELLEKVIEELKTVYYAKYAMEAIGMAESTFHKWRQRGEAELERMENADVLTPKKAEAIYVKFVMEVRKARASNVKLRKGSSPAKAPSRSR